MTSPGPAPTVGTLGEDGILARVVPLLPTGAATLLGPGDDAAVVAAADGRVVVSTDVLVEGRHFRRDWSGARDVGRKAVVQNLADVAAMGARPTALVVALVVPTDLPVAWAEDLARGLADACGPDVGVVGGDLSSGPQVVVSVTVLGDLEGRAPVVRSGARPGDVVAHAGVVGWSAAGQALLEAGRPEVDAELVDRHRAPSCPLAAGPAAALAGATAMLDVSDGLVRDAGRIAGASGVQLALADPRDVLAADRRRLHGAATALGADAGTWLLGGGEDHGLLATFPAGVRLPVGFRRVGVVREREPGGPDVTVAGDAVADAPAALGWDHFGG